ncbi:MAG: ABC transporter ATP-binding protein [Clostridiales bacterium]|nr:ABC transporter ATP-binding protein [Clostridiales bacterium]
MRNITKTFGPVVANDRVCLTLEKGEILALLGENGSGKTTLMNMLSGIYLQDSGEILVCNRPVTIRSPKDAYALGIGMIHQHFKLVDVLTAAENIVLGLKGGHTVNRREINARVREIAGRYGFDIDPAKKIYNMSVSEKQTVEIIKALYRGADILILDEPTAVLTPQETTKLFAVLRMMKAHGKSIIIITHKLGEVMEISDRVAILRKGEYIATVRTAETTRQDLTEMMVGRRVKLEIDRPVCPRGDRKLHVTGLTCVSREGVTKLKDVALDAFGGEILGVAGVAGSGQKELCETITGLKPIQAGSILYRYTRGGATVEENIAGMSADKIAQRGISLAFVPEDRLGMGLVANMNIVDNVILRSYQENAGMLINRKKYRPVCENMIRELDIVTPGLSTPVRRLSGGNVQKVLLGREILSRPQVLICAYPVRGLDIVSSYRIYALLNAEKQKGNAVIFIGEDLDVLMDISDRILVLCGGQVSGVVDPRASTKEEIGLMMTRIGREKVGGIA